MSKIKLTRALISVSNKDGLAQLAKALHESNVEIVSTGATAQQIADLNIPVTNIAEVTKFDEILDGRVKTLHPQIHAGILADSRKGEHKKSLAELNIKAFDLVVVNLYPFGETVASGADLESCIEQIDIGGTALIRSAAKNFENVSVIVSPDEYPNLISNLNSGISRELRNRLLGLKYFATAKIHIKQRHFIKELVQKKALHKQNN